MQKRAACLAAILGAVGLLALSGCGLLPSSEESQGAVVGESAALHQAEAMLNDSRGADAADGNAGTGSDNAAASDLSTDEGKAD